MTPAKSMTSGRTDPGVGWALTRVYQGSMVRVAVNILVWWWMGAGVFGRAPQRVPRDVSTRGGTVRGYLVASARPPYYAFLGVPYARSPTRANRFKVQKLVQSDQVPGTQRGFQSPASISIGTRVLCQAPEPAPKWDGLFEATHRVRCPQDAGGAGAGGDENCLVLNVFAGAGAGTGTAACCALPVLVFVHDGGFHHGWGAFRPPAQLLHQDFVIVTFNYRLGALGFLCLGTAEAPGNAGLKDQVAALYWIKRNIASFGGNPHDITVYGTGSGAVSVQLLLLSGLTEDLVHRVILESGSILSPFSITYEPFSTALNLAISLGYEDEGNIEDLERFYREVPYKHLLNTSMTFLPCIENDYYNSNSMIDQDPIHLLNQGNFDKVPMLVVYTNADEISLIEENSDKFQEIPEEFVSLLPNNLEFDSERTEHRVSELIKGFYFKDIFDEKLIQTYMDYINDIFMNYPIAKFTTLYASRSSFPVYLMKFSYSKDSDSIGAKYGEVFNNIFANEDLDNDEIAGKLLTLLSNFMKMGDPTPLTTSMVPVIWQPVDVRVADNQMDISKVSYLVFDKTVTMSEPGACESLAFWDHIYEKFYKLHMFDAQFQVTDMEETMDLDDTVASE